MALVTFQRGPLDTKTIDLPSVSDKRNAAKAGTWLLILPYGHELEAPRVQKYFVAVIPATGCELCSCPHRWQIYINQGAGAWQYIPPPD
jgi:hypothetical protein